MKEKDLDKNLENIIIDGLIKEAEQENADFAAEMRKMSKEEFEDMVYQPVYADSCDYDNEYSIASREPLYRNATESIAAHSAICEPSVTDFKSSNKSRFKLFSPWITAALSAAAVVLLILIPSFNAMNAKLCDSALYMSEAYITAPKGGFDISSASIDQIEKELPKLEQQYQSTIEHDGKFVHYHDGFQDAGWTLTIAYLKLHKKNDAVKVLKTLESQTHGTSFGDHCKELLKQLD